MPSGTGNPARWSRASVAALGPTRAAVAASASRSRTARSGNNEDPQHASVARTAREVAGRSEEHTSELQSRPHLVCRLLLEKKKKRPEQRTIHHLICKHKLKKEQKPAVFAVSARRLSSTEYIVRSTARKRAR